MTVDFHTAELHNAAYAAAWIDDVLRLNGLARRLLEGVLERAEACQLTGPQFCILWSANGSGHRGVCQLDLVQQTGLSAAHVSGLVEQLRQRGLLVGQRDPADRRRQVWSLTPAGRQCLAAVAQHVACWLETEGQSLGLSAAIDSALRIIAPNQVPKPASAPAPKEAA